MVRVRSFRGSGFGFVSQGKGKWLPFKPSSPVKMERLPVLTFSLLLALFFSVTTTTDAHNITRILAKHPEFSTFNHYLTLTHLAADINRRLTITVCAVDNTGMSDLLAKHLSIYTIRNVLSLHVFADYFGAKKLHQISKGTTLTATMYQATGEAPGTAGYVNITNFKGGRVGFGAEDNDGQLNSFFVKSIQEMPYNISVIQISHVITSPEAEAPTSGPGDLNLTVLMARQGCQAFSELLTSSGTEDTFVQNVNAGLTVFCPTDGALKAFDPRYKNLTAAAKTSLLLYHGVPVYNSMGMLRSNNGLMNTLATEGANKYDFTVQNDGEDVKLATKVVTATIQGTLIDEEPVAIYKIDKVLLPRELFKAAPHAPAPKNAPASRNARAGQTESDAPEPSESDDDDPADQTADSNGSVKIDGGRFLSVVLGAILGVLALL